jgi:hypothetical protein
VEEMGEGNGTAWAGALSPAARYAETGGASLTWENLTAVLPGSGGRATKKLLQGLYGYAVPGRIVAIMGPSGSGKSTLLDSLSGMPSRVHYFFWPCMSPVVPCSYRLT